MATSRSRGAGKKITRRGFTRLEHLGREQGTVIKDWGGRIPFAIVYPNSYYIGMSNLGVHILYQMLNRPQDTLAERFFTDNGNASGPPLSLESGRRLADYAAVFFSVSFELDYFNIAKMLESSGIPLYAEQRDESHPLLIAGGACVIANPMPLAPFFDCCCIGEAEPILPSLVDAIRESGGTSRRELIERMGEIDGVYILAKQGKKITKRVWQKNLDELPVKSVVITNDTELRGLYLMEVERGCNWDCNFCLVASSFCPLRYHSFDNLIEEAKKAVKYKKRIGLVGPAPMAHPSISALLEELNGMGTGLSISSLRLKMLSEDILASLQKGGVRTITLAPEAGSARLRRLVGKNYQEEEILAAVDKVAAGSFQELKLYFMVGLPTEEETDIIALVELVKRCKSIIDKRKTGLRLSINLSPFIPKAGTPFQWLGMAQAATLKRRITAVKKALEPRGVRVRSESPAWSEVQTVLSRGDSKVSTTIAMLKELSFDGWRQAVAQTSLDIAYYAHTNWEVGEKLPWNGIELGAEEGWLEGRLKRALDTA